MLECILAMPAIVCLYEAPDLEPPPSLQTDVSAVVLVEKPEIPFASALEGAIERAMADLPQVLDDEPDPAVRDDAQSAQSDEEQGEGDPEPPTSEQSANYNRSVWDDLADCESGNWIDGGASFEVGSARWAWGGADPIPPWGTSQFEGGLQFHPGTWSSFKDDSHPAHAYDATRGQQIAVAERVLEAQGWSAWPVCSEKIGLR